MNGTNCEVSRGADKVAALVVVVVVAGKRRSRVRGCALFPSFTSLVSIYLSSSYLLLSSSFFFAFVRLSDLCSCEERPLQKRFVWVAFPPFFFVLLLTFLLFLTFFFRKKKEGGKRELCRYNNLSLCVCVCVCFCVDGVVMVTGDSDDRVVMA